MTPKTIITIRISSNWVASLQKKKFEFESRERMSTYTERMQLVNIWKILRHYWEKFAQVNSRKINTGFLRIQKQM